MSTITVNIPKSLYKKLDPAEYTRALQRGMSDATKIVMAEAQVYPPRRPNQKYIRTGNLRRSWNNRKIRITATGVEGLVYSSEAKAPYNAYVQHPRYQAWMHRGRWQTTDDVARKNHKQIAKAFEDQIKRVTNKP